MAFLQSRPTPDQVIQWQKANPFPKKQGKLEVSGPFSTSNTDKILVFRNDEIFQKATVINKGDALLTWWLNGFPMPYFFSELADGRRVATAPKYDHTFSISRTPVNPEKNRPYSFSVKADTDEHVTIILRVGHNPNPFEKMRSEFADTLRNLRVFAPTSDERLLSLQAAEQVIEKKSPHEKESFRAFLAAQLLFALGHHDAAVEAYKKSRVLEPELDANSQFRYFLAIATYFSSHSKDAAREFTQVSKLTGKPITDITDLYSYARSAGVPDSVIRLNVWSMAYRPVPSLSLRALVSELPSRIARATANRVEIEPIMQWSPQEQLTAVGNGRLDLAVLLGPDHRTTLPFINIASLPGLFNTVEGYEKASNQILFDSFNKVLNEKYNLVLLATGTLSTSSLIFSNTPIKTVDDLKGLKIRATNDDTAKVVSWLGGHPLRLPGGELYSAMVRGVVNATITAAPQSYELGLFDITKYAYDWKMGGLATWVIVTSQKTWESLPTDLQIMVRSEFKKVQLEGFAAARNETQKSVEFLKQRGVMFVTPSNADLTKMRDAKLLSEIYDEWVLLNKQKGIDAAEVILLESRKKEFFK